jgi:hypothetical protein
LSLRAAEPIRLDEHLRLAERRVMLRITLGDIGVAETFLASVGSAREYGGPGSRRAP